MVSKYGYCDEEYYIYHPLANRVGHFHKRTETQDGGADTPHSNQMKRKRIFGK
jgi:hypothetical protein